MKKSTFNFMLSAILFGVSITMWGCYLYELISITFPIIALTLQLIDLLCMYIFKN